MGQQGEGGSVGVWTDEKHTSFLNGLEASFVRWMSSGGHLARGPPPLRLDRCLPDGADSTLDCRTILGGRRSTAAFPCHGRIDFADGHGWARKRWRRRCPSPPVEEDQVVPGMVEVTDGENITPTARHHPPPAMTSTGRSKRGGTCPSFT